MGSQPGANVDAWLREGGFVVASSDRAARAIRSQFHRRQRAEGLSAWRSPKIADWKTFARSEWEERNADGRLLLNNAQELAVWSKIIRSERHLPTALPASVRRLATMAMDAHDLICSYAPRLLHDEARTGWDQDAGAFSNWLSQFSEQCRNDGFISLSRIPLELIQKLRADATPRPALLLAGFDRILPVQLELFEAWGESRACERQGSAAQTEFYSVRDTQAELGTCAYWCRRQIEANPDIRLLVITQDQAQSRGEIERAFLRFSSGSDSPAFEFSLGIPLTQIPLVRSALLLLRWLQSSLNETELDWLFACGLISQADESASLQRSMRTLRRLDLQRPLWELESFLNQASISSLLPRDWVRRILSAQRGLKEQPSTQSPIDWADKIPNLLATAGWQGAVPQSSIDFQIQRRWSQAIDTAASLGFDGSRFSWNEFLSELEHAADGILFSPQSLDAPIQIAGPAESAGLTADAIWFLGAEEEAWPAVASMHPFLPPHLQREFGMPHSSPLRDWEFSEAITKRLLASAQQVHFSYAAHRGDVESRPSRLIAQIAGPPHPLPYEMNPPFHDEPTAYSMEDFSTTPFRAGTLHGGSSVLSSQSQCPFKAFATARLGAQSWDAAENGLSARQRGQILHDVLHSIWSGHKPGITTHRELVAIAEKDLAAFVRKHAKPVMQAKVPAHVCEQMPALYLELEETRLVRLITEWLEFELTRLPFAVEAVEARSPITIAGLSMNLRLDRVDRLHDGSQLVVDYKTGGVDPKAWDLPRPDDVQLPLYKLFGLAPLQPSLFDSYGGPASGGLVFARVRTGNTCFAGRAADAKGTLDPTLSANTLLVKRKLTATEESAWKEYIETLANDFLHGRAEVDPRDYPFTCKYCGLQPICRIQEPENRARFEQEEPELMDAIED
ncbi:MAG: PD-(D/E)XK nuclease family protein [Acidobacteria bacterium]|nr:PD-(D/E)XK nuclease family protein [Acidobacteriota bacterium]